jgi:hypothetical protein
MFLRLGDQICSLNFAHLWQNWSTDSSHSERIERLYMEKAGSPVTALFTLSHIHLLQHLFIESGVGATLDKRISAVVFRSMG